MKLAHWVSALSIGVKRGNRLTHRHANLEGTKEEAMLLGIDYGITRTGVAAADRGTTQGSVFTPWMALPRPGIPP
jgi:hypothetical protein